MPVVPLYESRPAADADAWHRVTAPGGYEEWYCDAEDPAGGARIAAALFDGFPLHPVYVRRYARYRRRPTRNRPPVPAESRCVYAAVYERDKLLARALTQVPADAFAASAVGTDVRVGRSRLYRDQAGDLRLSLPGLRAHSPSGGGGGAGQSLSAELTFRPLLNIAPCERTLLPRPPAGGEHRWVIADPLCDVRGTIRLGGDGNRPEREIDFHGRGYHDHQYGSRPLAPALRGWFRGRVLLDDAAVVFHLVRPRDRRLPDEVHVLEARADGITELPAGDVRAAFPANAGLGVRYPPEIEIGDLLRLDRPKVLDASPVHVRLSYRSEYRGRQGEALCEAASPSRAGWPILGGMIAAAIAQEE